MKTIVRGLKMYACHWGPQYSARMWRVAASMTNSTIMDANISLTFQVDLQLILAEGEATCPDRMKYAKPNP
jgi:hypothetical protein